MATFTMYLKDVLVNTDGHIGLDAYPIFDETYREDLNKKITDHFYNREIGTETIDLFIFSMRRKMNEIMPLYNQLYVSARKDFDPLLTFETSATSTTSGTNEDDTSTHTAGSNTSSSDGRSRAVTSETPQTMLAGNEDYASGATDSTSATTGTGSASQDTTTKALSTQGGTTTSQSQGFQGSRSELLIQWRQTFLNIDMMVIAELEPLFMQLWSNGDEFTAYSPFSMWF